MEKSSFHRQQMEDMNLFVSQRVRKRSVKKALEDGIDYSEGALYFVEKTMANPKNIVHGLMRHLPDCLPIKDILFTNNA